MISIYSKGMTNMKKNSSEKQFSFLILRQYTKFCVHQSTKWKVENIRYIAPHFYGAKMRQG